MNYEKLKQFVLPEIHQTIDARDAIIYALSVCAGNYPSDTVASDFLVDTRGPKVLPSFCVDLGHPGFWLADPKTTVDATKIVHAEEAFKVFQALPNHGDVIGHTRIVDIVDKGSAKGALLYLQKDIKDAATGTLLASVERTVMLRGDGGFDGPSGEARQAPELPSGTPDIIHHVDISAQQAFLYRLNGDPNPLHIDNATAEKAGFPRPILHGLCTFGIASTVAFLKLCEGDLSRFHGFKGRFTAPVYPGENLRIEVWHTGDVRVVAEDRDIPVLTHGFADIH